MMFTQPRRPDTYPDLDAFVAGLRPQATPAVKEVRR